MATKTKDKNPRLTGTILLLVCLVIVIGVAIFWQQEQYFQANALKGEGTVVRLHTETRTSNKSRSRREVYLVTYRFILPTSVDGQREVMKEEEVSGGTYAQMEIGQKVTVLYLANDPTHPRLEIGNANTTFALLILIFSGVMVAILLLLGLKKLLIDAPKMAEAETSDALLGG